MFVLCLRRCPHGPTWRQGLGENDPQAFLGGAGQSTANVECRSLDPGDYLIADGETGPEVGVVGPRPVLGLGGGPWSGLCSPVALFLPIAHLSTCCRRQGLPLWPKLLHVGWVGGQSARLS